jgi:putative hydrolase
VSFGFLPNEGQPDFEAMMRQFTEMGLDPAAIESAMAGAKTFFDSAQSIAGSPNQSLIAINSLRDIARKVIASTGEQPIGTSDQKRVSDALAIASTWLDSEVRFPTTEANLQPAWSKRDWLDSSLLTWQQMIEPLAVGMADALANVINGAQEGLPVELAGLENQSVEQQKAMKEMLARLLRSFMGTLIATQLGQSIGAIANNITGANDAAIPLSSGAHLIPQNITQWSQGLGLPEAEVDIYLALREVSAARLFASTPWLMNYIRDAITTYGKGITIDVEAIQRQAEEAMGREDFDINNPQSLTIAIDQGLFTPQQTPAQEFALTKLEMALALIEGWIDHVISEVGAERIPSFNALIENSRRRRAVNSPMQQLFATLLGLEVSPRKMREAAVFWSEVKSLRGSDGRDRCWEDPAFLPMPNDLKDAAAFLNSVTVPDDLSGLI